MKILIVNSNDFDGGAARSAYRLNTGLRSMNIQSNMLVQNKKSDDFTVVGPDSNLMKAIGLARPHLDKLPLKMYSSRDNSPWSISWISNNLIKRQIESIKPDIVNLHWVCGGFLSIKDISKIAFPIIWTLHDSWPFTGGCHLPYSCVKYQVSCKECPQIKSKFSYDISAIIFNKKSKLWANKNFTIVTPSKWLGDCARSSYLFRNTRIEVIPNGIDIEQFKPIDKSKARKLLRIPMNKKIILFGAINSVRDSNKGFEYLHKALLYLSNNALADNVELLVFGASEPQEPINLGLKTNFIGRVYDEVTLSLVYSSADVFVAPSKQENLPNTVMESLACGTPCVAFNVGGMPDLIEHQVNGYLVKPFDAEELSYGIRWVLEDDDRINKLRESSRKTVVDRFQIKYIANKYCNLYRNIFELYNS